MNKPPPLINGLDPYLVLNLDKNFTVNELKTNYKQLVRQYHPDKSPEDIAITPQFQILTACYKMLLEECEKRKQDKSYTDLKSGYQNYMNQYQSAVTHTDIRSRDARSGKFDVIAFNREFEKNKIKDYTDEGYGDWANNDKLYTKNTHAVVKYKEPQPLEQSSWSSCYQLGVEKLDHYGLDNYNSKLHYTDFRVAHTTDKIIDLDKAPQRREYKNIQDLENERANMRMDMTPAEVRAYERRKQMEESRERQRLERLRLKDNQIEQVHLRLRDLNFNK